MSKMFFLLILLFSFNSFAQWNSSQCLNSVRFWDKKIGWAVGNNGTILKSTDGGITWEQQNSGTTKNLLSVVPYYENVMAVITVQNGSPLFTTDGGTTWNENADISSSAYSSVQFFYFLGYCITGKDLLLSIDWGAKWEKIYSFQDNIKFFQMIDGNSGWAVDNQNRVFITSDAGKAWNQIYQGNTEIKVFRAETKDVAYLKSYSLEMGQKLYKLTNSGNLSEINSPFSYGTLTNIHVLDDKNVFASGSNPHYYNSQAFFSGDIAKSTNNGATWNTIFSNQHSEVKDVFFIDNNYGWAVGDNGLIVRIDNSTSSTWDYINNINKLSLSENLIGNLEYWKVKKMDSDLGRSLIISDTALYELKNGNVIFDINFGSSDFHYTWDVSYGGDGDYIYLIDFIRPYGDFLRIYYKHTQIYSNKYVLGLKLIRYKEGVLNYDNNSFWYIDRNGYTSTSYYIPFKFEKIYSDNKFLYLLNSTGDVLKYDPETGNQTTFPNKMDRLFQLSPYSDLILGSSNGVTAVNKSGQFVWNYTPDFNKILGAKEIPGSNLVYVLMTGAFGTEIFIDIINGTTGKLIKRIYQPFNNVLQYKNALLACDEKPYIIANRFTYGVFTYNFDPGITEAREYESEQLDSYFLNQNYPNPFNPSTIINYSVQKSCKVSIIVYDILGKVAAELVNEEKPQGNYSVEFNPKNLSSGVYIYTLRAGDIIQSKKMIFIK